MSKIKLKQSINVYNSDMSYSDILKEVNELKTQIQEQLIKEGLENEFDVIVSVNNSRSSLAFN